MPRSLGWALASTSAMRLVTWLDTVHLLLVFSVTMLQHAATCYKGHFAGHGTPDTSPVSHRIVGNSHNIIYTHPLFHGRTPPGDDPATTYNEQTDSCDPPSTVSQRRRAPPPPAVRRRVPPPVPSPMAGRRRSSSLSGQSFSTTPRRRATSNLVNLGHFVLGLNPAIIVVV